MAKAAATYAGFASDAAIPASCNALPGSASENKSGTPTAAEGGGSTRAPRAVQPRSFGIPLYLTFYNWCAAAAWAYVLFLNVSYFVRQKSLPANPAVLYKHVEFALILAQSMQIAEVLHAAFGFVRSSPFITFTQVFSRCQLVLFLFRMCPRAYTSAGVIALLFAWSIAELIRYPYFGVQALLECLHARGAYKISRAAGGGGGGGRREEGEGAPEDEAAAAGPPRVEAPALLKWLRYSGFTVLYPVGIAGEVLCMIAALPELKKYSHFPTPMPNWLNFEVNLHYLYIAVLLGYIPGSILLFTHMLQQRKKCLYGLPATSDDRKKRQ